MDASKIGQFCWNQLSTPDMEATKNFYGELLGWEFTDYQIGDATYTIIKCEDEEFAGMWKIPADRKIRAHWMGYILVDDIDVTLEKSISLGAVLTMPITQAGERGRLAVVMDPVGAHIAFWQRGIK